MELSLQQDAQFENVLKVMKWLYALTGVGLGVWGAVKGSMYQCLMGLSTLALFPILWGLYRLLGWQRGYQLEFWIYLFVYLGFTLGGVADFYMKIQGFDKAMHALSGTFVAMLALTLYMALERNRSIEEQNPTTVAVFVFFASMAVAALFEICEFVLAPIIGRDLQHVADTGVTDTIVDMLVCLLGTLIYIPLVVRFFHGKYDPLTGAVDAFLVRNKLCGRAPSSTPPNP